MALHQEITNVNLPTTVETVVATFSFGPQLANPPLSPQSNIAPTRISGVMNVSAGTTATGVIFRVRQNSLTGSVVGAGDTNNIAPPNSQTFPFSKVDPVGATQYVITVAQIGATAAGTVNTASLDCDQNLAGIG